jgi:hypothetical protein
MCRTGSGQDLEGGPDRGQGGGRNGRSQERSWAPETAERMSGPRQGPGAGRRSEGKDSGTVTVQVNLQGELNWGPLQANALCCNSFPPHEVSIVDF